MKKKAAEGGFSNKSAKIESNEIFGDDIVVSEQGESFDIESPVAYGIRPGDSSPEAISGAIKSINSQNSDEASSPDIASNDVDADWKRAADTGEEGSLGPNPTPDQDQVDEVSGPWGTDYRSKELLNIRKKARRLEQEKIVDEEEGLENK